MNAPAGSMSVWVGDSLVCFKVGGRANFTASVDLKMALRRLCQQGRTRFVLDLTDCLLMDSTFLGVLSGIGLRFNSPTNGAAHSSLELLNPNPRITELLENLGIVHLFKVSAGPALSVTELARLECAPAAPSRQQLAQTSLEAHQTLMAINPANIPKFKDVAQFLAEELKQLSNDPPAQSD